MKKKNIDLIIYSVLFVLMVFYAIYIKGTCEELGCLAIILPIIGIMVISVIEFFINLYFISNKHSFTSFRKFVFIVSGIIAIFSLLGFLASLVN